MLRDTVYNNYRIDKADGRICSVMILEDNIIGIKYIIGKRTRYYRDCSYISIGVVDNGNSTIKEYSSHALPELWSVFEHIQEQNNKYLDPSSKTDPVAERYYKYSTEVTGEPGNPQYIRFYKTREDYLDIPIERYSELVYKIIDLIEIVTRKTEKNLKYL